MATSNASLQRKIRNFHKVLAPIMVLPLLLTAITGSVFQLSDLADREREFRWVLALHVGHFGIFDLRAIYPFLNALGLIVLVISGLSMWLQIRQRSRGTAPN